MSKMSRTKQALLNRLEDALRDMYHNATPIHPPIDDSQSDEYWEWFQDQAEQEITYIARERLGVTDKEWRRYERIGFPHNERYYWLVQRITEWGRLFTWGRGGRTLAPTDLVRSRGGSGFSIKDADDFADKSNEYLADMIEVIEAFNKYVTAWCSAESIAAMWKDEQQYRATEDKQA